jgi:LmbE family N-acetylglucosaminyl deacetylase
MAVDVARIFAGSGLIVVPHMDDEVLACGGTIALLPDKSAWHVAYATDGMASPEPTLPRRQVVPAELGRVRRSEAQAALTFLGLPAANVHFMNLPDGRLRRHRPQLQQEVASLVHRLKPDHLLIPFRYDRHPDHLALNHALVALVQQGSIEATLSEYFVYYLWRLLPGGDVRRYVRSELLHEVDVSSVRQQKRAALDFFKSQTTCYYPWQTRPNLTNEYLDGVCREPEMFLRSDEVITGAAVFARAETWIRLAHSVEPPLKRARDRLIGLKEEARRAYGS